MEQVMIKEKPIFEIVNTHPDLLAVTTLGVRARAQEITMIMFKLLGGGKTAGNTNTTF